MNILCENMSVY